MPPFSVHCIVRTHRLTVTCEVIIPLGTPVYQRRVNQEYNYNGFKSMFVVKCYKALKAHLVVFLNKSSLKDLRFFSV